MKKVLLWIGILGLPGVSFAGQYFRPMDPSHIHQSAGFLIDPNDLKNSAGVTDVALITHSTQDGSIIPEAWQRILPPEDWSPLTLGFGGSFHGSALVTAGSSANLAPQLLSLLVGDVDFYSPALQALKNAIKGVGDQRLRLGYALAGEPIKGGVFQSAKQAFPGRGIFDILKKASRFEVGYAWVW